MSTKVTPYQSEQSKKQQVESMFDNIAGNYDFLNHFLSAGIDVLWRKKAIRLLQQYKPKKILDVATGTADFAIEALTLNPDKITGIDLSEKMLEIGRKKITEKKLEHKIELLKGDSENLPFEYNVFDAVTVAFGVRNFENLEKGIAEIYRVLNKKGILVVLEFSKPTTIGIKQVYNFYFSCILPLFGRMVSKDNRAYTYLPESVQSFPDGSAFLQVLEKTGFKSLKQISLTFGIASIYIGEK